MSLKFSQASNRGIEVRNSWLSTRTTKSVQCAALFFTAAVLIRSGMDASLSNLFTSNPNPTATIWGNLESVLALLLVPTSFAILTRLRSATLVAIVLSKIAASVYGAQALLLVVNHFSDQVFILVNSYLKELNPLFPLAISLTALIASIFRLKTYEAVLETP